MAEDNDPLHAPGEATQWRRYVFDTQRGTQQGTDMSAEGPSQRSRRWLWRTFILAGAVLLALTLALAGTGALQSLWRAIGGTGQSSNNQLHMTRWQLISAPASDRPHVTYVPSPSDPATMYVCAAAKYNADASDPIPVQGLVSLWRTHDDGRHWGLLPVPQLIAGFCNTQIASDAPQRLTLLVRGLFQSGHLCQSPTALFSRDGGDTWAHLTLPTSDLLTQATECDVWTTQTHLFFWFMRKGSSASDSCPADSSCAVLFSSADDGKTWQRADGPLAETYWYPILPDQYAREDLYSVHYIGGRPGRPDHGEIWLTRDAGRNWRSLGTAPADTFTRSWVSQQPNISQELAVPLYEAVGSDDPSMSSTLLVNNGAGGWHAVPPLPVRGADGQHVGIARFIGIGAQGVFFAFGPKPSVGVPTAAAHPDPRFSGAGGFPDPAQARLWAWNPRSGRWMVSPSPLPQNPYYGTISWGPGPDSHTMGTYIWLLSPDGKNAALSRAFAPEF